MNLQNVLTMASLYAAPKIASYLTSPPSNTNQRTMSAFEKFRKSASEFSKTTINTIGEHNWIILTDFISDNAWVSYGVFSGTCPAFIEVHILRKKILILSLYFIGVGVPVFMLRHLIARMIHPCCPNFAKWITPRHFPIAPNRSIPNGNSVSSNNSTVTDVTNRNIGNVKAEEEFVPEEFEEDRILSQYKCPITQRVPMRPVSDPTTKGKAFYSRQAASDWLTRSKFTSPMTRKFVIPGFLREDPTITELIKWRIDYLKNIKQAQDPHHMNAGEKLDQGKEDINKIKHNLLLEKIDHLEGILTLFKEEIPEIYRNEFLFKMHICPISGLPIRHLAIPNGVQEERNLYYEKKAIEAFIREKPDQVPNEWPVDLLPLPLKLEYIRPSDGQDYIDGHIEDLSEPIKKIIQELQLEMDELEVSQ